MSVTCLLSSAVWNVPVWDGVHQPPILGVEVKAAVKDLAWAEAVEPAEAEALAPGGTGGPEHERYSGERRRIL